MGLAVIDPKTRELLTHAVDAMASVLALAQALLDEGAEDEPTCEHPPAQVECLTTFGGSPAYQCHQCGAEQSTPFHDPQ